MNDGMSPLPNDLQACHKLIAQLTSQLAQHEALVAEQAHTVLEIDATRQQLSQENEELKLTVQQLLRRLHGRRSERFVDPNQLLLAFGDDAEAATEALEEAILEAEQILESSAEQKLAKRKERQQRGASQQFPAHLERYEVVIDLLEEEKAGKKFIGYDVLERLEFERPKLRVRVTKIAKYADAAGGVISPPRPVGLVEGDRFDTSVAVEIIAARWFYHLPYYRQQDLFASCGWTPSRSTLVNLAAAVEQVLRPLVDYYYRLLRQDCVLGCDDTSVTLIVPPVLPKLDPAHPRTARIHEVLSKAIASEQPSVQAKMWAYRAVHVPINVFDFTVSRHRDGPDDVLSDYCGTLLGDCWSGFQKIELRSDARIRRAACWAHARRKFDECSANHVRQCPTILALIQLLYDVETRAKECTPERRADLRQQDSQRILQQLRAYLDGPEMALPVVLPKSKLAQAANYVKNNWAALSLFVSDGRIPFDNNETEQLMKQVATGRKNWLHIGSVAAGERSANLMTIVSTAVRNDLDVSVYLKDVLDKILAGCTDWESLRADRWKESHPQAIRTYRVEERRDAIDRKRTRRARRRLNRNRPKR